jgi:cytochrome P450
MHGRTIPARTLVLTMIGSANHNPKQFRAPARFDIKRHRW